MKNNKKVHIQHTYEANISDRNIALFDIQTDFAPTKALLHKQSRFLYVVSGLAQIKIQNKIYTMKPGVMIALLPWQISEIISVSEPVSYYLLIYNFELINDILKRSININDEKINIIDTLYNNSVADVGAYDRRKISTLLEDIRDEIGIRSIDVDITQKSYSSIYILSRLTELIIYFLRLVENNDEKSNNINSEEIFKYMYLNSSSDMHLSTLSKIFSMSESAVSKYITNLTGLSFRELLNEMRLSKAQFLLLHTNLTLDDISVILNFSDSSQLSKVFSTNYGISTKKFKNANKDFEDLTSIRLDERGVKIIDYIYDNYENEIDISDISKIFDISPKNINKILKYYVEKNFSNFLNAVRVNKSCSLLINTNYSIIDIGASVGFETTKTFVRNFEKMFYMTPTEFRASILEQDE